jgi:hypothetical protein
MSPSSLAATNGHWNPLEVSFALLVLACFLPMVFHEAGHVVCGIAAGFRLALFIAGPISIIRKDKLLTVSANIDPRLWAPRAACTPRSFGPELRMKMLWFTAGGPLFSLAGGAAVFPALALRSSYPAASGFLFIFGVVSLGMAMITAVPITAGGSSSDGARIFMLLRNGVEGKRWVTLGALAGIHELERPRDWPADLIERMGDGSDSTPDAVNVCLFRYLWHADRREYELASEWLQRALAKRDEVPASFQCVLWYHEAWMEARQRHNSSRARECFDRASRFGVFSAKDYAWVGAAVLIAEKRFDEARIEIERAASSLGSKPPGVAASLRDELADLRASIGDSAPPA